MRPTCYIAGPITRGDLQHNIRQANDAFFALVRAGFAPLCPHWSCYSTDDGVPTAGGGGGLSHAEWIAVDLAWVQYADAVLRLPGESVGADTEVQFARQLAIPVFDSVDALTAYFGRKSV